MKFDRESRRSQSRLRALWYRHFDSDRAESVRRLESKPPCMRIGIVNDTGLAREALRRVVLSSPEHEVVWTASDGAEAIALARERPARSDPDGPVMPGIDGVEATRRIMGESLRDPDRHRDGHRPPEQGLSGDGLRRARCGRHADSGPSRANRRCGGACCTRSTSSAS